MPRRIMFVKLLVRVPGPRGEIQPFANSVVRVCPGLLDLLCTGRSGVTMRVSSGQLSRLEAMLIPRKNKKNNIHIHTCICYTHLHLHAYRYISIDTHCLPDYVDPPFLKR